MTLPDSSAPDVNQPPEPDASSPPSRICDGSSSVRFGAFIPTCIEPGEPYSCFLDELGKFLYVDGNCQYWTSYRHYPHNIPLLHREGVLTPDQEQALAEIVHYGDMGWVFDTLS